VYAFIEKEECSKEEKTRGQNREITQIQIFPFTQSAVDHQLHRQQD
jgi:hypothetical protein